MGLENPDRKPRMITEEQFLRINLQIIGRKKNYVLHVSQKIKDIRKLCTYHKARAQCSRAFNKILTFPKSSLHTS